jgi:lipopolysaccharide/colanic/teichoic acid biosynthesis glycosyltransferase
MHLLAQESGPAPAPPTLWGLRPLDLHDRFWAARGVQVVRPGDSQPLTDKAELYLLVGPHAIVLFQLRKLIDSLSWLRHQTMFVRIQDDRDAGCRDRILTGRAGEFLGFERLYHMAGLRSERMVLTADRALAQVWGDAPAPRAWRVLRQALRRDDWRGVRIKGGVYDRDDGRELMAFVKRLVEVWERPGVSITGTRLLQREVWAASGSTIATSTRFLGPAWIGEGRRIDDDQTIVGPAVLWDAPEARPAARHVPWNEIHPTDQHRPLPAPIATANPARPGKRLFDILFALAALAMTLPLYPLIMFAILLEDGWPVFFSHRRETLGGRTFGCLKFRSMRRSAEAMKAQLAQKNKADGPQFFIEDDPRLTRVGRFLRRTNLDELPQFINVLWGHMSIVGPRPSPYRENQYCPAWREARLSTRPGITGLWQVMRSRDAGLDFQEWIRYDIAYVENMNTRLDLWIIWKTLGVVIRGVLGR